MSYKVSRILENVYSVAGEDVTYIVSINAAASRINEKGEVISDADFFQEGAKEWECRVSAPFVFLLGEFIKDKAAPKKHLLNLLQQEVMRVKDLDLSKPFEEIAAS